MDYKPWLCSALLIVVVTGSAQAGTVSIDISTGIDRTTGTLVTSSSFGTFFSEQNYTVTGPGGPWILTVWGGIPFYIGDSAMPGSRWDELSDSTHNSFAVPPGFYDFHTQIDLKGVNAASAAIKDLKVAADNGFVSVAVNGVTVASLHPASDEEDFHAPISLGDVGLGAFKAGINNLDFFVQNNQSDPSPAALRVSATVQALTAPEPVSLVSFGMGALALGARFCLTKARGTREWPAQAKPDCP